LADFNRGEQYLDQALAIIEAGGMPEGQAHFHRVFNRNGLAMIRNFQGRHQDAIKLCQDGIAYLDQHLSVEKHRLHRSVLVYNIAQVYRGVGSHAEAIKYYSSVIEMDPNYSEYYNERGSIFLQLNRLKEALADYLKAIELSPPYFEAFTNLGQCYRKIGSMHEAVQAYAKALDLEPDHVLALLGRGNALQELGQAEQAKADYSAALARDANLWDALASRAVIHYETGDLAASLSDFNRAIELKQDDATLLQNRATVLFDLKQYHEAVRDLENALKLDITEPDQNEIQARIKDILQVISDANSSGSLPEVHEPAQRQTA
jgi:tetratricopeptide (TPR) repeat protein